MSRPRLVHNRNLPSPNASSTTVPSALHFSLNVNGLNTDRKQAQLLTMRNIHGWKVLYLSDTRIYKSEVAEKLQKRMKASAGSWSLGSPHRAGTAILFFMPVNIVSEYNDPEGRYTRVDYIWEGEEYSSICVYAPADASERPAFFDQCLSQFFSRKPLLDKTFVAGDWNFVSDPSLDRRSLSISSLGMTGSSEFDNLSAEHDLSDLFRHYHPTVKAFTFSRDSPSMSARLDRVYITKNAVAFTSACKHVSLPTSVSDHEAGVSFTVRAINAATKGSGYWKLNCSLLKRPGYQKLVENTIADFMCAKHFYPDTRSWWESLKLAIRLVTEPYAKEQTRRRKATVASLEKKLLDVNKALCSTPDDPDLPIQRKKLSQLLADYYQDVHDAARLRAGAKHSVDGEKPTAYFSSLVKARAQKSLITEIQASVGSNVVSNIEDILHEATKYYTTLYQSKSTDKGLNRSSFLNALDSRLSSEDRLFCDRKVNKAEVLTSLKKLSNGKAPGVDGLPVEFYKFFWPKLGDAYLDLLEECFCVKELPLSMRTSIITLIYKKEDRKLLKNYRPISLLCADYKIIAKVFAERMKLVMHKVVKDDQTGFVPGRNINENIITFLEVQEHLQKHQKSGFAFLADIEKAFDSVCRDFLEASLVNLNFGDYFISWFLTLHNKSTAKIIINGFLSNDFPILSGVRQGCPWAPLLFLAATEPLACNIRKSGFGISLPHEKISYKGYADDTCCYISDMSEIRGIFDIFHTYKNVSGLKLNEGKSTMIPLGRSIGTQRPPNLPCKWLVPGDHEAILGIQVGSLYSDDAAWNEMIKKFYRSIRTWIPKYLTIFGRICAVKSYIASKSWYLASVIPPNAKFVAKINSLLWNFVQNNTCLQEDAPTNRYWSRWSSQTLRQPLQVGGLNALQYSFNLSALHSKWVFSLLDPSNNASWKVLPYESLMKVGLDRSIFISDKSVLSLKSIPPRWKHYLTGWFEAGFCVSPPPLDYECLLNESLWFNRFIRKENENTFGHHLTHERIALNGGPRFIADLVTCRSPSDRSRLRFKDKDELRILYGATTAKVLDHLIKRIPGRWCYTITMKVREPFQIDDWVVQRRDIRNGQSPVHVYKVLACLSGKLRTLQHAIASDMSISSDPLSAEGIDLSKAHTVKACTVQYSNKLLYYGSYAEQKLLLSRISWSHSASPTLFPKFSIRSRYLSIRENHDTTIAAEARWTNQLGLDIDWHVHYKYLKDTILSNHSKQLLYKILTRACMTGVRVQKFGHSTLCPHCDLDEDEFHLFIDCSYIRPVWLWFKQLMSKLYPHINFQQIHPWHLLTGNVSPINHKDIKPWKIMHAELLGAIWYARNQRIFEDDIVHPNEIISLTKLRALHSIQVYHHILQISPSRNKRQRIKRNIKLWTQKVPLCTLNSRMTMIYSDAFCT